MASAGGPTPALITISNLAMPDYGCRNGFSNVECREPRVKAASPQSFRGYSDSGTAGAGLAPWF